MGPGSPTYGPSLMTRARWRHERAGDCPPGRDVRSAGAIIRADQPEEILAKAHQIAKPLADLIESAGLAANVGGRRKHVEVGGWQACGTMLGALGGQPLHAETIWTRRVIGDDGGFHRTTTPRASTTSSGSTAARSSRARRPTRSTGSTGRRASRSAPRPVSSSAAPRRWSAAPRRSGAAATTTRSGRWPRRARSRGRGGRRSAGSCISPGTTRRPPRRWVTRRARSLRPRRSVTRSPEHKQRVGQAIAKLLEIPAATRLTSRRS
jgi:hypothetical protein